MKAKKGKSKNTLPLLMIALPGIVYLFINNYIPMFGLFIAFKNYSFNKGIWGSDWCGLKNFKFLFVSNDAWVITRNTILYNLVFIVVGTVVAVALAIMLFELGETLRARFFQSALLFPHLISWVVSAYLVYALLNSGNGFINNTIMPMLGKEGVDWYTAKAYWPFIITLVYLWKQTGYTAIVYMASMSGIDKGIFEAAEIDGAGKLKQIFCITIPLLKPSIMIMTLMSIGRIFYSDFGLFYQIPMDSGQLFSVTQTIDTYVYRGLMVEGGNISMSAAAGFYQSVLGFTLIMGVNALVKKLDPDNALF